MHYTKRCPFVVKLSEAVDNSWKILQKCNLAKRTYYFDQNVQGSAFSARILPNLNLLILKLQTKPLKQLSLVNEFSWWYSTQIIVVVYIYVYHLFSQVPNSLLQIPPEHASNHTPPCLQHGRFVGQHNLLSKGESKTVAFFIPNSIWS